MTAIDYRDADTHAAILADMADDDEPVYYDLDWIDDDYVAGVAVDVMFAKMGG